MTTLVLLAAGALLLPAQADGPARAPGAETVVGDVASVQPEARRLTVRTEAGALVVLTADDKTVLLRSRPGAKDLGDALPLALGEIVPGDRVLARGSADRATFAAQRIVVMTKTDLEARREQEKEDWRRRGIAGVVAGVDPRTKELTVRLRSPGGGETVTVPTAERAVAFRRYAPDSVKFSDTRPSSFEDLREGDQVRLLGARDADGTRYVPEQVVSGAFQTVRGLVTAVDAEHGRISLAEGEGATKRGLTVTVGADTVMRRLPPGVGSRVDDALESLPALALADLKVGDTIAVLSTRGADPARLTAIKLVAGLPAAGAAPGRRGRRGGVGVDLGVPPGVLDFGSDLPW